MYDRMLLLFSASSILVFGAWIVIPYARRRQDLISARSFFLAGGILYVGLSGINSAIQPHYYDYGSTVYWRYFAGTILFFVAFHLANTRAKWPVRWANRQFRKWPPLEGVGIVLPIAILILVMAAQIVVRDVPGLSKMLSRTAIIAPVFALTFAMFSWFRGKFNPAAIAGVVIAFAVGAYIAFSLGGGRRPLYAMLITIPCCIYWWKLRYMSPRVVLAVFCAAGIAIPIIDSAFRAVRHYGVIGQKRLEAEEGAKVRWQMFRDVLSGGGTESLSEATLQIGHNSVEISLVTIYMTTEAAAQFPDFRIRPFHTIYVIGTLLVPRSLWENKPIHLGITLPFDSKVLAKTVKTNWGTSIVAHGYHEGGPLMLIFYGLLTGCGIRYFDELLRNNPANPYMIGFLASGSVQIMGWVRGDLATMVPLTMLCFVVMMILAWISRLALGAESPWRGAAYSRYAAGGQHR